MTERIYFISKDDDSFFAPGAAVLAYNGKTGQSEYLSRDDYDAIKDCRTPALPMIGPSKVDGTYVVNPMGFIGNYQTHVEYLPKHEGPSVEEAAQAVVEAWTKPGPVPEYHAAHKLQLRRGWPTLHRAIADLVEAAARQKK